MLSSGLRWSTVVTAAFFAVMPDASRGDAQGIRPAQHARPQVNASAFADLLRFVQEKGWSTNLRQLCETLGLPEGAGNCMFRQIAVQDETERSHPRGLNVSSFSGPGGRYVLMFHLQPLTGEFFVVSPEGTLVRAYYRAVGGDYEPLPNDAVRDEFLADLHYWVSNLERLKAAVHRTPSGSEAPH